MTSRSRHIGEWIDRRAAGVYDYVSDPAHIPQWASGLGRAVEEVDGEWFLDSDMGRIRVDFAERNDLGVLDHDVTLPTGQTFNNPMRVLVHGDGCEVVFTLRRLPGVSDEEFERDASAVAADLARLKRVLEAAG
ncbi:MAG TPA: SRPBCC family protein [Actinomycetales bacterium]|nr:SRPBCC family protein [Actinomycetales bacterium]